jgi:copper resistance protein B
MNAIFRIALAAAIAMPAVAALAQDHAHHPAPAPKPTQASPAQPAGDATKAPITEATDHAAMGHGATPVAHPATPQAATPASDHGGMDHGGMDHAAMGHAMPRDSDSPRTPIPALTDADRAAATPPSEAHPMHDDALQSLVMFNRLEGFDAGAGAGLAWEARAWLGTDTARLWLRSEGERVAGRTEHADVELLYGRAITPWWELLAGVRHDDAPGPARDFVAVGVQGLAPYKIEVQAMAYLGPSGQTAARIELEYKTLLTNRLILQPLVEAEFHGKDDPRRGIGAGLGQVEAGLRLRYELSRRFAPYVGVVHGRAFGRTADMRRARGEADEGTHLVAGVRLWF